MCDPLMSWVLVDGLGFWTYRKLYNHCLPNPHNLFYSQVEFDTPRNLLRIERGVLKALVDGSGDKDNLYAMAMNEIPSVVQS